MNKEENMKIKITDEMLATPGVYIIDAPTGAGKSRAVKELKVPTLVVSPRRALVDQQVEETFKGHNNITVRTVQSLAYMSHPEEYLEQFSVVISDETHDLILGADYDNKMIQLTKIILHAPVLICLTATDVGLETLFSLFGRKAMVHKYADNVWKTLKGGTFGYIPDIETAIDTINRKVASGEKVLFFADKISQIVKIQKGFLYEKQVLPVVAKSNSAYKKLCKDRAIEIDTLIKTQKFPVGVNIVCTTRCMDVGLNILDPQVTTVICSIDCLATLRQCLGRKRLDEGETVDFYCIPPKSQSLTKRKEKIEAELGKYDTYCNHYEVYKAEREGVKLSDKEIVYHTYTSGKKAEEIDFCKLVYYKYLMSTIYKTPTTLAWRGLVEQMLGCQGVQMKSMRQKRDEQWQYEQTKKLLRKKLNTKDEKKLLIEIYHEDLKSPKAFNRLWEARGWDFRVEGDLEGEPTYVTDENGKRKKKRNRNAWMVSE